MQFFPASDNAGSPNVAAFYERASGSWQYVAWCPATKKAVIIDPVLDFDPAAGATWTYAADEILAYVKAEALDVEWVLDTHPHADHFSSAHYIKEQLGGRPQQAIGALVLRVQDIWSDKYADDTMKGRSEFWDRLFEPGESFKVGDCAIDVTLSTGHTLASITYTMGDAVFAHDTFMVPDSGSSRCDFPGGSSAEMWDTLQAILANPDDTRIFVGHDYCKGGREEACMATVAEHKASNIHVKEGTTKEEYIATRDTRDATLPLPGRMLYALQVNIRGGRLPDPDEAGRAVLKVPLNRFTSPLAKPFKPS
ncbi:Beta-lactamase hydrolase-like protein [Cognatishimia activa]|uniref:Beta-lactamase hydrolase-like protein n=1 Tax=Cognatishimia activa TaxID=1715691 RepID=A0A0P1IVM1_9RHOB|nr:MBL fold metallo-hydrolase [Cognatishimia activa]MEE2946074.1 MBL fold metallo-hydrolase [Pseudomonadota bacterium]CUK27527.1 Beta-lactamase hydrolase-like protein [Cognatishimia activa]